jgi:hypothetical protein
MRAFNKAKQQQHIWSTVFVLACVVGLAAAYPELFVTNEHANGCTAHPSGPLGGHASAIQDRWVSSRPEMWLAVDVRSSRQLLPFDGFLLL